MMSQEGNGDATLAARQGCTPAAADVHPVSSVWSLATVEKLSTGSGRIFLLSEDTENLHPAVAPIDKKSVSIFWGYYQVNVFTNLIQT